MESKCIEFEWQIVSLVKKSKSQVSAKGRKSEKGTFKYVEKKENTDNMNDTVYFSMENSRIGKFGPEDVKSVRNTLVPNDHMTDKTNI